MSYTIRFANQNKEIIMEKGTLAQACEKAGYPLPMVCGGKGLCGKCRITVKRNGISEQVLACKEEIQQDEILYIEDNQYMYDMHEENILVKNQALKLAFQPSVKKIWRTGKELMPERCGAYLPCTDLSVLRTFSAWNAEYDFEGCTFVSYEGKIIDIQKGDTSKVCYGVAIDIGTTTVVCYIYDLVRQCLVRTKSAMNRQCMYGADVITRNAFAQESPDNLCKLQKCIRETINEMLEEAIREEPAMKDQIYHIVLCGNSVMQHLFFGLNPAKLGVSPFANITAETIISRAEDVQLHGAPAAIVEFLPLLGGFVGADTAAVLSTLPEDDRNYMMVDLGTNGEIAVGNQNGFLVSSAACGPALEGGNIACGMRGTAGAIEKVSIDGEEVRLQVIGDGSPRGLCGSGVIDAVFALRKAGLVDERGTLLTPEQYEKRYPGSRLGKRLHYVEEYNPGFYFTEGENPVYLCQKDIRQMQLAKSAIYSGCMTLLAASGMTLDDIDALVLAGAFGNYIDIDHALAVGLLPPVKRERIIPIGNGAGKGVQAVLLDSSYRKKIQNIREKSKHIELADRADFTELYVANINFS